MEKIGKIEEESYDTLTSKTLLDDTILFHSLRLISVGNPIVEVLPLDFCVLLANLSNKSNAKKIVNGFQDINNPFTAIEDQFVNHQQKKYVVIILQQLKHRSALFISLEEVRFLYFDPYFKNRDEIESKFFVEFWSGCCTKLCSKIRQSDRLPNNFRKKFDAEIDSFENVIEKSIEQNQLDIKLSSFYLIQYMAQFFSKNKLDLKQLILSPTNNDVFMKNVFINFWRILTKPFVQKRNKRKRELDFF